MKPLTKLQKNAIAEYDRNLDRFIPPPGGHSLCAVFAGEVQRPDGYVEEQAYLHRRINRTRFYKYLTLSGDDVEVRAVAVKARKSGEVVVKEIVRSHVDGERFMLKDVVFAPIAGYTVDWSPEGLGRAPEYWGYNGDWGTADYSKKSALWKMWCPVVNPEELARSERFKACAWTPECGDILDYLKTYVAHPGIKYLSRAGLGRFTRLESFLKRVETDKEFMRFLSANLAEIKKAGYKSDVVVGAYRKGMTLEAYARRMTAIRFFEGGFPKALNAERAALYVTKHKLHPGYFCSYVKGCERLGLDLQDTKTAYPKDFRAREKDVAKRVEALEIRERADRMRETDKKVAAVAERFAALEALRGKLCVVMPRRDADLVNEGKQLDHCVKNGTYTLRIAAGDIVIGLVRLADSPQVPYVTATFDPILGKITQCLGEHNHKPEKKVLDFVYGRFLETAKKAAAVG